MKMEQIINELKDNYLYINFNIDFSADVNAIDFSDNELKLKEDISISEGIDLAVEAAILSNTHTGKELYKMRKKLSNDQVRLLGNEIESHANVLAFPSSSNNDKKIYSIDDLDLTNLNHLKLYNAGIGMIDYFISINKDEFGAKTFIEDSQKVTSFRKSISDVMSSLSLFIKQDYLSVGGFKEELNKHATINVIDRFNKLNSIKEKYGSLNVLNSLGFQIINDEHIKELIFEHNVDPDMIYVNEKRAFCIQDMVGKNYIQLNGLRIDFISQSEFKEHLYKGNLTLNELVMNGREILTQNSSIKDDYESYAFNDLISFKTAIEEKQKMLDDLNKNFNTIRYSKQIRDAANVKDSKKLAFYNDKLASIYSAQLDACYSALQNLVLAEHYSKSNEKVSVDSLIEIPETNHQKELADYKSLLENKQLDMTIFSKFESYIRKAVSVMNVVAYKAPTSKISVL